MADVSLHFSSRAPSSRGLAAGTFTAFANVIGTWRTRSRERAELAQLDARSLRDLGLNPGNIQFEANKPFWRD
jgi:uncharacterized protein YjiS (DUF1127 family)